ncbi:26S proteasome complex subunit SEM1 [Acrasis kona]|uniref:26S proteasome complex subunit SEM1 n=1 Tax=Acrasis kona TaxID=1008807 RepID=A0AAW2YZ58_9EUKA
MSSTPAPVANKNEEIDILEDDEFEEFEDQKWDESAVEDQREWEEDWDDEDVNDFSNQLREELKRNQAMDVGNE